MSANECKAYDVRSSDGAIRHGFVINLPNVQAISPSWLAFSLPGEIGDGLCQFIGFYPSACEAVDAVLEAEDPRLRE